jgi:hypothetical protein
MSVSEREQRLAYMNKRWKAMSQEQKVKIKNTYYKKRYGISYIEVVSIWEKQNQRCAICKEKLIIDITRTTMRFGIHVDHDHETGMVRGLLCALCNIGLGSFLNSVEKLENAIIYIEGGEKC